LDEVRDNDCGNPIAKFSLARTTNFYVFGENIAIPDKPVCYRATFIYSALENKWITLDYYQLPDHVFVGPIGFIDMQNPANLLLHNHVIGNVSPSVQFIGYETAGFPIFQDPFSNKDLTPFKLATDADVEDFRNRIIQSDQLSEEEAEIPVSTTQEPTTTEEPGSTTEEPTTTEEPLSTTEEPTTTEGPTTTTTTTTTTTEEPTTTEAPGSLQITTISPLPEGGIHWAYYTTINANGGTIPYSWDITSGTLPDGITGVDDGNNRLLISGIPNESGTFTFTARVIDADTTVVTKEFTLLINSE
jgi:hypothetical protein